MIYYVSFTIIIFISVEVLISKTRPAVNMKTIPSPFTVPVWLFAWLRNGTNGVIQLAVFRLLRMNYLTIIHTEHNVKLCANQQHYKCEMSRIEKILFDHFTLPKISNQNLPMTLYRATENDWVAEVRHTNFMLSSVQQRINQLLVVIPACILIILLLWKAFYAFEKTDAGSINCLLMLIISSRCWFAMSRNTLDKTNLDRKGFSVKVITACTEHLKQSLTCRTLLLDENFVDYSIAVNAVGTLPIKYREYYNIALTIQLPQSIEYTNS